MKIEILYYLVLLALPLLGAVFFGKKYLFPDLALNSQAKFIMFDNVDSSIGDQIVSDWKFYAFKISQLSPVEFTSKITGYPGQNNYVIKIILNYGLHSLIQKPELIIEFENLRTRSGVMVNYKWAGPAHAITRSNSADCKLLNYLFDAVESIIKKHGGTHLTTARITSPQQISQRHIFAKTEKAEWWRSFEEGKTSAKKNAPWPTPQDFLESVQNPHLAFSDSELKVSRPETNQMGLPKVASGTFATVYEFRNENKKWAVRCFNNRPVDAHKHYKATSEFVLADDLTYTVDFHYLAQGIKHNSEWYPILKMDWAEGDPLNIYIRNHLTEPATLEALRRKLRVMHNQFRRNGIAHGDLQHGNILVDEGEIYLVDYDGMYVPALNGERSNEIGHRNYQHPERNEEHFGPYLDNFSAWLIDASLICLIEDPSLWSKHQGGDECILFRSSDLKNPGSSRLFKDLLEHNNPRIRQAAEHLSSLITLPIQEIPFLEMEDKDEGVRINIQATESS